MRSDQSIFLSTHQPLELTISMRNAFGLIHQDLFHSFLAHKATVSHNILRSLVHAAQQLSCTRITILEAHDLTEREEGGNTNDWGVCCVDKGDGNGGGSVVFGDYERLVLQVCTDRREVDLRRSESEVPICRRVNDNKDIYFDRDTDGRKNAIAVVNSQSSVYQNE